MQKVDECYKRSVPLIGTKWSAGQLVVARFPDDEFFYRAKIISLFDEGRMAEVRNSLCVYIMIFLLCSMPWFIFKQVMIAGYRK